jgi:hypothetical protein
MVDATTDGNILAARASFDLGLPVYLCLGNHDLTITSALDRWMALAPAFFGGSGTPAYSIPAGDCVIHVVPNHWEERPYYWGTVQNAHLSEDQIARLADELESRPHVPHVVLTHSPVHGVPVDQTGFPESYHSPNTSFTASVTALAASHDNLKCVLGAHSHVNMRVAHRATEYVTVSSLVETPFELKLFEVTSHSIAMSTVSLSNRLDWAGEYDPARAFVQGRVTDRSFTRCV